MAVYYNEFDPQAAAWLRELIKQGLIADGEVDERSIADVKADEIRGFTQCHFFAGIGGWSYALRLAGWSDDRPVWTGSPPCQPFSNAGKQKGKADARHLWPVFFNLIRECQPTIIFGEQVEAAIRTGWLDDLQDDLEAENYATGKIVLPACSVGSPHIRQRIWFVADRMADPCKSRLEGAEAKTNGRNDKCIADDRNQLWPGRVPGCESCRLADTESRRKWNGIEETRRESGDQGEYRTGGGFGGVADTANNGFPATSRPEYFRCVEQQSGWEEKQEERLQPSPECGSKLWGLEWSGTNTPDSPWRNPDWLYCRDGKWRPVESSIERLVDGLPDELVRSCNISSASYPLAKEQEARKMRLKGYGNAIVAPLAAEFIKAYLSIDFGNA